MKVIFPPLLATPCPNSRPKLRPQQQGIKVFPTPGTAQSVRMVWPLLTLSLLCAAVHSLTFLQPPAHHQRKLQLDHHQRDRPFHQNNPHKPNYYERETPALPHKVPQHSPLQEQGLQHVRTLASMGNRRQFGGPEPEQARPAPGLFSFTREPEPVNTSSPATALSPSPPWPSKVTVLYCTINWVLYCLEYSITLCVLYSTIFFTLILQRPNKLPTWISIILNTGIS